MARFLAYWLVPSQESLTLFQELVETLAHSQRAPVFTPHVTIYACQSTATENPLPIIEQSMRGVAEVRLRVEGVSHSELFTKTLFVQFHPSDVLSRIADDMRRLSSCHSDYMLNPHLSLLYKNMSVRERETLATGFHLPVSEVRFDEVWAVAFGGTPQTAEDVNSWKVMCRTDLRELAAKPDS